MQLWCTETTAETAMPQLSPGINCEVLLQLKACCVGRLSRFIQVICNLENEHFANPYGHKTTQSAPLILLSNIGIFLKKLH